MPFDRTAQVSVAYAATSMSRSPVIFNERIRVTRGNFSHCPFVRIFDDRYIAEGVLKNTVLP